MWSFFFSGINSYSFESICCLIFAYPVDNWNKNNEQTVIFPVKKLWLSHLFLFSLCLWIFCPRRISIGSTTILSTLIQFLSVTLTFAVALALCTLWGFLLAAFPRDSRTKLLNNVPKNVKHCLSEMLSAMSYEMLKGGKDQSGAQMKQRKFGSQLHFALSLSLSRTLPLQDQLSQYLAVFWTENKKKT